MTDFPFDASGCCPACGDATDTDSLLCDDCADMVRNDPRAPARPCQNAEGFIAREEQKHIELMWSGRNVVTGADLDFLADLKIIYGGCCGLELNAEPKLPRTCLYCGQPADDLGWCENMRKYMACHISTPESRMRDDQKFLRDCGIAVEPAQGTVIVKIEMAREFVLKHKKNRNRKAAGRRRKSAFRPKEWENTQYDDED